MRVSRHVVLGCFIGLILLGLAWELWLAPLRPGGSLLVLKVLPLALSLPALWRDRLRAFQWWSMGVMLYLCEGVVRGMTESGAAQALAGLEVLLSVAAFAAILIRTRLELRARARA